MLFCGPSSPAHYLRMRGRHISITSKDAKGQEHELKWLIKVTRSDVNEVAEALLRHEKQVYARLMGDLINTVKARAAGRLEGSRLSFKDLLLTPQFIFEETSHQERT